MSETRTRGQKQELRVRKGGIEGLAMSRDKGS